MAGPLDCVIVLDLSRALAGLNGAMRLDAHDGQAPE